MIPKDGDRLSDEIMRPLETPEGDVNPRYEVDVKTLEMLVCPLTKTRLVLSPDRTELISVAAHLAFPIREGVPMLSLDEARDVEPDQLRSYFPPVA